jgi:hypothetical protein
MSISAKRAARKKQKKSGEPQVVTRSVTRIRLDDANVGKLAALDALAPVFLALCQRYVTLFCTEEPPNPLRAPCLPTSLSQRWQRVAIMQAAGIAQSWQTNRRRAEQDYQDTVEAYQEELEAYREQQTEGTRNASEKALKAPKAPVWREWNVPILREWCIQTNMNVAKLEPSEESSFDYWLTIATLDRRHPTKIPVKLAPYHREALTDQNTGKARKLNSSVQLNKRDGAWWLTLSYDATITAQTPPDAPVVGIDVGIANFLTTSTGKHYGTMHGKLRDRHRRDREKRRRKAKLRACLKRKGVKKLPSTSSRSGQRLIRQTRQAINRAVNQCYNDPDHQGVAFAYEELSVVSMRFKAKMMNSYLRASNLAHIPNQIAWNSKKRGVTATPVIAAYSSQECSRCHYTHRDNRPDQKTFFCRVCGYEAHADTNAAANISRRVGDRELRACRDRTAIKSLLMKRHDAWKKRIGKESSAPVKQRKRSVSSRRT